MGSPVSGDFESYGGSSSALEGDDVGDFLPDAVSSASDDGEIQRVAYIRTSDRSTFRRCRRKFGWSYIHRGNRTSRFARSPLWFGTGIHYALEDYHGYKYFPTPKQAFEAYVDASRRVVGLDLPQDLPELITLGQGMCDYYETWLQSRDAGRTLLVDGVPQVEVRFQIDIPLDPALLQSYGYDRCVYTGTIDRIILDEYGRIWLCDYKTAKVIKTDHLDMDPQVTAYCWAASQIYDYPVAGFVYQQHRKAVPHEPEFVKSTRQFSISKTQNTTYALYKRALTNMYGSAEAAPRVNIAYLNQLATEETKRADKIIRRDFIERNQYQIENEGWKILAEAAEMLNPSLPLFPNPTRDCSWDCSEFKAACLMLDDGSDWNFELQNTTIDRTEEDLSWRRQLLLPVQEPQLFQPPVRRLHRLRRL